jgi:hypothetical protein
MKIKGKDLSLASKLLAVLFVVVMFVATAIWDLSVQTWDIIQVGMFLALAGSPVDISLWIQHIKGTRGAGDGGQ